MIARENAAKHEPSDLFGNYKAEWLVGERIFKLFRQPAYFPDLERPRPCVLIGGRGTGKTTVLRNLSYEGRYALNTDPANLTTWPYFGFYYRVNTNRVTAFQGPELSDEQWQKLFGHYLNLILCQQVVRFLVWFGEISPDTASPSPDCCGDVSQSLNLKPASNVLELQLSLKEGLIAFESALNNIRSSDNLTLSIQGAPIDILFSSIKSLRHFADKSFFFLIDEYENFLDYQQVAFNTLLKHASSDYTFKIGVRELGWRQRFTLNDTEELNSPADYVRVDIAERLNHAEFKQFAQDVCDAHLSGLFENGVQSSIVDLFPNLVPEQEADLLGAKQRAAPIRRSLVVAGNPSVAKQAPQLSDLELLLLQERSKQKGISIVQAALDRHFNPEPWQNFVENYRYAILFQIAPSEAQIRKYYCGWTTFTTLAASNIRYLLELVDHAFREHERTGDVPGIAFSPKTQTLAAQAVGRKNLFELEGYKEGALLVKLVLGLGRVFGIMARYSTHHAPEQNQFCFHAQSEILDETKKLISNAVMHSAIVRSFSNKLNKDDARSYDYALHPIYSAFFAVSHRRKRKIVIDPTDLIALVESPRRGVAILLERQGRAEDLEPLPDQLRLFGEHI